MSPALAGRFLTTVPPEKSGAEAFMCVFLFSELRLYERPRILDEVTAKTQHWVKNIPKDARGGRGGSGVNSGPQKTCPPRTCECDLIWK